MSETGRGATAPALPLLPLFTNLVEGVFSEVRLQDPA
jgi:hypothetical protein